MTFVLFVANKEIPKSASPKHEQEAFAAKPKVSSSRLHKLIVDLISNMLSV